MQRNWDQGYECYDAEGGKVRGTKKRGKGGKICRVAKRKWRSLGFKCLPFSPFVNFTVCLSLCPVAKHRHMQNIHRKAIIRLGSVRFSFAPMVWEIEHEPKIDDELVFVQIVEFIGPYWPIYQHHCHVSNQYVNNNINQTNLMIKKMTDNFRFL